VMDVSGGMLGEYLNITTIMIDFKGINFISTELSEVTWETKEYNLKFVTSDKLAAIQI
jgi:hypothetical protein